MIFNAILLKFTEQIGPYVFKRVKKKQLVRREPVDTKVSNAVKQAKTLTTFEVIQKDFDKIISDFLRIYSREPIPII